MKLSVRERLYLAGILPGQGDITTLRIIQELQTEIGFSEEEHKALKFWGVRRCNRCELVQASPDRDPGICPKLDSGEHTWVATNQSIWNLEADKATVKDVEIGEKAMDVIKGALEQLSGQKKLGVEHMGLYERFVEKKEPEAEEGAQEPQGGPQDSTEAPQSDKKLQEQPEKAAQEV